MLYAVSNPSWEPQWTRHTRDTSGTLTTSFYIEHEVPALGTEPKT